MSEETTAKAAGTQAPLVMTHGHKLENKFAIGDEVWAVVALGPNLKVGKYPIRGMNAENLGEQFVYMYHLPVANDGHADGVNMTIVQEDLLSFNREEVEAKAQQMVGKLYKEYDNHIEDTIKQLDEQIEQIKEHKDKTVAKLMEEKEKVNADDLVVQPREVSPEEPINQPVDEKATIDQEEPSEPVESHEGGETDELPSEDKEQPSELQASPSSPAV